MSKKLSQAFPDCEINYCEQRTDEWFAARRGILTMSPGSGFGAWILKNDKRSQDKRESVICEIIADTAEAWKPPIFVNAAMKRGTELEPDAEAAFEKAKRRKIVKVGFCRSTHGLFGCSPDGLLRDGTGFEGKIPQGSTHIKYRRAGELPEQYKWQVLGSMAVTGAQGWWFQSWNPGLAPLRVYIERTPEVDDIKQALIDFSRDLKTALREEAEVWRKEFQTQNQKAA